MQKVGYSLLNENNIEIQHWGSSLGSDRDIPNPIFLPDGTHLHAPTLGEHFGYKLVERWIDGDITKAFLKNGETISFDGNKIIVTWEYRLPNETEYAAAIQRHIDATAQARQYGDGISLASYDSSTNPAWAAEAQTFIAWRDAVWAYAFTELEKVKNGTRPQPSMDELLAELPSITWPQ